MVTIGAKAPDTMELLPGEETKGSYTFQVKNGVAPLELIVEPVGKQGCGGGRYYNTIRGSAKIRIPAAQPTSANGRKE